MNKDCAASIISQIYHWIAFSCRRQPPESGRASLIISIDVDVGSAEIGERNGGSNDRNVHPFLAESIVGRIEEQVVPLLLRAFDEMELPVTFALRGQLTEVENSIINLILESGTGHEIAAHGYSHRAFTTLSEIEAEGELTMISTGMKKFGIVPKSFVFPQNKVSYLPLLEKHNYVSFRAYGDFLRDGMYVKKCGNLFDVHPSLYLEFYDLSLSRKIINVAERNASPLHLWFHSWNLGHPLEVAERRIAKALIPLIKHARKKEKRGTLKFETMLSLAEKYKHARAIATK